MMGLDEKLLFYKRPKRTYPLNRKKINANEELEAAWYAWMRPRAYAALYA